MNNLNLEFSGNVLRVLQLNQSGEIILKKDANLSFNINEDPGKRKNNDDLIDEFEECLNEISSEVFSGEVTAAILISTEQTFLNVAPIDFNEDPNSISSHILWELSNYFPDNYKDFNIKYFRLSSHYLNDNVDDALLIAVNKNKIEFIKTLCDGADIKIKNIEIDHFAVEKYLKQNYSGKLKNKNILLIGCKNGRLDYSLISNEALRYYDYDVFEQSNFKNLLAKQINRFDSTFYKLDEIYLYGDDSLSDVMDFLNEQYKDLPATKISGELIGGESKFAPLLGLALKNMS